MTAIRTGSSVHAGAKPWNKVRLLGPKPPFELKDVWTVRVRIQLEGQTRDLGIEEDDRLEIAKKKQKCRFASLHGLGLGYTELRGGTQFPQGLSFPVILYQSS